MPLNVRLHRDAVSSVDDVVDASFQLVGLRWNSMRAKSCASSVCRLRAVPRRARPAPRLLRRASSETLRAARRPIHSGILSWDLKDRLSAAILLRVHSHRPRPISARMPTRLLVPPSWFLTTLTVCSALELAGLLHPARDHEVRQVSGGQPSSLAPALRSLPPRHSAVLRHRRRSLLPFAACTTRLQGFHPSAGPVLHRSLATTTSPMLPWAFVIQVHPVVQRARGPALPEGRSSRSCHRAEARPTCVPTEAGTTRERTSRPRPTHPYGGSRHDPPEDGHRRGIATMRRAVTLHPPLAGAAAISRAVAGSQNASLRRRHLR